MRWLPAMTLKSTFDYILVASGIVVGLAIWKPVLNNLEDSLKKQA